MIAVKMSFRLVTEVPGNAKLVESDAVVDGDCASANVDRIDRLHLIGHEGAEAHDEGGERQQQHR